MGYDSGMLLRRFLPFIMLAAFGLPALAQTAVKPKPTQPLGTKPADRSWYFGSFMGQVISDKEKVQIRLRCPNWSVCEYSFVHQPAAAKRPAPIRTEGIQVLDHEIANKNLAQLREAVNANPNAYKDEQDGPLLRELRPLIESKATFDLCVGVSDWSAPWGRLCRLHPEGASLPPVVLLLPTMGGECKKQNFCNYYFFPLHRPPAAPAS
jgi:hypothetical protein